MRLASRAQYPSVRLLSQASRLCAEEQDSSVPSAEVLSLADQETMVSVRTEGPDQGK